MTPLQNQAILQQLLLDDVWMSPDSGHPYRVPPAACCPVVGLYKKWAVLHAWWMLNWHHLHSWPWQRFSKRNLHFSILYIGNDTNMALTLSTIPRNMFSLRCHTEHCHVNCMDFFGAEEVLIAFYMLANIICQFSKMGLIWFEVLKILPMALHHAPLLVNVAFDLKPWDEFGLFPASGFFPALRCLHCLVV